MDILRCFQLDQKYRRTFAALFFCSMLYVLPLMLIDVYYRDDLSRTLYGATGWKGDGRPLGEALLVWLSGGGRTPITDIAPLPLILSVCALSYALALYAQNNLEFARGGVPETMFLLLVLTNPFAMENLSYRFDCIMMFGALSIPFVMYAVLDRLPRLAVTAVSAVCTALIMSLYQPAVCMCLVLSALYVYLFLTGARKSLAPELYRAAGIAVGAVFYKLLIAPRYMNAGDWRNQASGIMPPAELVPGVLDHIRGTWSYVGMCAAGMPAPLVCGAAALVVFAVLAAGYAVLRDQGTGRGRRALGIAAVLAAPAVAFAATFLPLALLEGFHLKSRVLLSFGGFLFFAGVMILRSCRGGRRLICVGAALCMVCLIAQYTYMYTYAGALRGQNEYQKYLVYHIAHDIETINWKGDYSSVTVIGDAPRPRQTEMVCVKYPFLREIVPKYIGNDTWVSGVWLYLYLQNGLSLEEADDADMDMAGSREAVLHNSLYSCYTNGDKIIVSFQAIR